MLDDVTLDSVIVKFAGRVFNSACLASVLSLTDHDGGSEGFKKIMSRITRFKEERADNVLDVFVVFDRAKVKLCKKFDKILLDSESLDKICKMLLPVRAFNFGLFRVDCSQTKALFFLVNCCSNVCNRAPLVGKLEKNFLSTVQNRISWLGKNHKFFDKGNKTGMGAPPSLEVMEIMDTISKTPTLKEALKDKGVIIDQDWTALGFSNP
ncbi:MAG: hypothetical protein LBD32_01880 [Cytophagales bacterium]|jgi:hypothetical protein|nr:hypothetical protein [Cytophagales bacterium]